MAAAITLAAMASGVVQRRWFGFVVLEPLVLALVAGLAIRAFWSPPERIQPGIAFAAKPLLEFAIVILGASLNVAAIADAGGQLLVAVLITVTGVLAMGLTLGRLAGLGGRQATLIAVGNAICGNSAIAAVAPAIRAKKQEVASAVCLTAVLGVGVVLLLPLLPRVIEMSDQRYGVIGGLTVYAVPQVLAATIPVSAESGQIASLVKLTRVLMLGPVVALFAWLYRERTGDGQAGTRLPLTKYIPWFVIGFLALALLRSLTIIPEAAGDFAKEVSRLLTAVAMAGLGLSVDVRTVRESGPRVALVVMSLTVLLLLLAVVLVFAMDIG